MGEKFQKILCGKLYDGIQNTLQENAEILVKDQSIAAVGHQLPCPENTETIDLSHLTVTPGMIDAHVHTSYFHWKDVYKDTLFNSDGYRCLAAAACCAKTLSGGFTTVRSMGWFQEDYVLDVKRAINEGYLQGSRLVVAPHLLGTSGSHGDMSQIVRANPRMTDHLEKEYPGMGNGADFFTAAVRREVKLGADFIKIMATGGFATPNDDPEDIQMNDAEFAAIFNTAKELGISVTAHAYAPNLMQKLLKYGIQGLEHGALMDRETAHILENSDTYLVPTFCPYDDVIHDRKEDSAKKSAEYQRKQAFYKDRLVTGREIILDSKIKLGYGTDFVTVHNNYESGWEYHAWLSSGADPFRALQAATKNNAEICEIGHLVGTIEAGKLADIAAWGRDLLKDPYALLDCAFVMKEGVVYPTQSFMNID